MDFHLSSSYFEGMKLSGPESRARKVKAGDALTHDALLESVFQFDPLIEISSRAWEAIDQWKEINIDQVADHGSSWEDPERRERVHWEKFFAALPPAVALKLMNPERYKELNGVRGKTQADLPPDLIKRQTPSFFEIGLLHQLYTIDQKEKLSPYLRGTHPDAKSVFGRALVKRQIWSQSAPAQSEKRYWEQPVVLEGRVRLFTEGGLSLEELALFTAVVPELHEHLGRFQIDFQTARQAFRRKLAFAMRNLDQADWRELIKEAFTLTLLGSDTELTEEGLIIKKRKGSSTQPSATLPDRPAV